MNSRITSQIFPCLALVTSSAYAETLQVTVSGIKAGQANLQDAVFDEASCRADEIGFAISMKIK